MVCGAKRWYETWYEEQNVVLKSVWGAKRWYGQWYEEQKVVRGLVRGAKRWYHEVVRGAFGGEWWYAEPSPANFCHRKNRIFLSNSGIPIQFQTNSFDTVIRCQKPGAFIPRNPRVGAFISEEAFISGGVLLFRSRLLPGSSRISWALTPWLQYKMYRKPRALVIYPLATIVVALELSVWSWEPRIHTEIQYCNRENSMRSAVTAYLVNASENLFRTRRLSFAKHPGEGVYLGGNVITEGVGGLLLTNLRLTLFWGNARDNWCLKLLSFPTKVQHATMSFGKRHSACSGCSEDGDVSISMWLLIDFGII